MNQSLIRKGPPELSSIPKTSIGKLFYKKLLEKNPSKVALIDSRNGDRIDYNNLLLTTTKLAKVLVTMGVTKNDFVTIISHNCCEYMIVLISAIYVGATVTLVNPTYTPGELSHVFNDYTPKMIFCAEKTVEKLSTLQELSKDTQIVTLDTHKSTKESKSYRDLLEMDVDGGSEFLNEDIDPEEDVVLMLSSSGTTGLSKNVMLTHTSFRNWLVLAGDPQWLDMNDTHVSLGFLPFFHIFGTTIMSASIYHGTRMILMEKFVPDQFFDTIQTYKISLLFCVPSVLHFMLKSPFTDMYDMSSVEDIIYGSAPASLEMLKELSRKLKITSIRQAYGLTETGGFSTLVPKNDINPQSETVGKPTATLEVKVCDVTTGQPLGSNEHGEIRMKTNGLMKGYHNNQKATEDAFDDDGFIKTGDLGYYDDDDDYFYVVDRIKEIIKYKGFQVPPAELEGILLTHPAIQEVGVVGCPDERAGELPTAFVVKRPGCDVTSEEIVKFVAARVSIHKQLHGGVRFVDELPKNATGKLRRNELRKMVQID